MNIRLLLFVATYCVFIDLECCHPPYVTHYIADAVKEKGKKTNKLM